jgi:hypothetical protein
VSTDEVVLTLGSGEPDARSRWRGSCSQCCCSRP